MMYNQKLIASIKANGKILREFKDTVYIPFGSEYSILLKNLDTIRCIVNVFIDGDNIVPGGLVLGPGQECDLERSIKNGNLTEGNRLKFIERTNRIENGPRGIKLEDGLVRIEYQFERVLQRQDGIFWNKYQQDAFYSSSHGVLRSNSLSSMISGSIGDVQCSTVSAQSYNDVGITVPGSKSEQKFSTANWFPTESETHTIILKLLGETIDNKPVLKPVTVKSKPKCVTCGKLNKAHAKFCSECGTSLEIFA